MHKMKLLSKIYDRFDVVVVPFPFTDSAKTKRRPALVVSVANHFNAHIEQYVMVMITTAAQSEWPLDIKLRDNRHAGLEVACMVRMKFFTLDGTLIIRKLGSLSLDDQKRVTKSIKTILGV